jgi:HK97 family phage prohead protease
MSTNIERRFISAAEIRVSGDKEPIIDGYAGLVNTDSAELRTSRGTFIERIVPGAFADAIGRSDIRALFNHNPDYVLGRVSAGTLTVEEDARGMKIRNTPPDTQVARDLVTSMRRGDITQMSFSFHVAKGGDRFEMRGSKVYRTITKFDQIDDVSPVTYPAYADTTVSVRSLDDWQDEQERQHPLTYPRGLAARRLQLALTK